MNICYENPSAEEYFVLRTAAGLEVKDESVAEKALSRSIFSVIVRNDDSKPVGMGRIIGDGGCFFQLVDIVVNPDCQAEGLEDVILKELTDYLDRNAPKGAEVILMADVPAVQRYKKYGFELTYPNSLSMSRKV
ncbi:GNAT family N-acetyltransferase [Paenibacillus hamazuiensis]|uniref:GNAT family N-acetyltransferase n=1 Tax=Paenibacillus hamazuiensis TaxID=2936508 RepID=UPI002010B58F|nr:GNAT family N-acetyltransferase [Paenibacillus hamazuiensis]